MLTEAEYLALRRFRDSFESAQSKPDDMTAWLFEQGFIRIERVKYYVQNQCKTEYLKTFWDVTPLGERALNEFEQSVQNAKKDVAKDQSEKKRDRRFQLFNTLLGAVLGAVLTLLAQQLPAILRVISELFQ